MNLLPGRCHDRQLILLAPDLPDCKHFARTVIDQSIHDQVLAAVQRFRGGVYLAERNLTLSDLQADGRHVQPNDTKSWHLLTLSSTAEVEACARFTFHHTGVGFSDLMVSHSALARSVEYGCSLRRGIEDEIHLALRRRIRFAELGGWALATSLRGTTEAARMALAAYALGESVGGAIGISTVNIGHHSASILRRIGGMPLRINGAELPRYYEPLYNAELEILRFDSSLPDPRYKFHVERSRAALRDVVVIGAERLRNDWEPMQLPWQPEWRSGFQETILQAIAAYV